MTNRKSCPVNEREFLVIENFNEKDKTLFNGTETVRGLNKFTKPWFYRNNIVILSTSKSTIGKTFVVPYIDKGNKRYWISDPLRRDRLQEEKLQVQKQMLKEEEIVKILYKNRTTKNVFEIIGVSHEVNTFFIKKKEFLNIKEKYNEEFKNSKYFNFIEVKPTLYQINFISIFSLKLKELKNEKKNIDKNTYYSIIKNVEKRLRKLKERTNLIYSTRNKPKECNLPVQAFFIDNNIVSIIPYWDGKVQSFYIYFNMNLLILGGYDDYEVNYKGYKVKSIELSNLMQEIFVLSEEKGMSLEELDISENIKDFVKILSEEIIEKV